MLVIKKDDCNISSIVEALGSGQTLIYPTETCYGLGCDATNQEAVDSIYQIKGRDEGKPLIVLMSDVDMVKRYVEWNEIVDRIAKKYWPGALTIVLEAKKDCGLAQGVVATDGTIAVRVSAHPFVQAVTRAFDTPLVSTSANLAGGQNLYDPADIVALFEKRDIAPDMLIDAGVLPMNKPSTVIKIIENRMQVVRQGEIVVD